MCTPGTGVGSSRLNPELSRTWSGEHLVECRVFHCLPPSLGFCPVRFLP